MKSISFYVMMCVKSFPIACELCHFYKIFVRGELPLFSCECCAGIFHFLIS